MIYSYNEALGEITDSDDGQLIATTSASCTPEQAQLLTSAPDLATLLLRCFQALDKDDFPALREEIRQVLCFTSRKTPALPELSCPNADDADDAP